MGKSNRLRFSAGLDRKPEWTGAGLRRFYCTFYNIFSHGMAQMVMQKEKIQNVTCLSITMIKINKQDFHNKN